MSTVTPWELSGALLQERLEIVARIAVSTRNRAFAEADRAAGDTNWGLACKAHERLMHALSDLVERHGYPWLTIVRDGLYLMPIIDGIPVRMYRGSADKVSSRHLDAARLEHQRWQAAAPQMAFDFMGAVDAEGPWYWMMAMETDAAGMVSRVVFHQANDAGQTRHPWVCDVLEKETPKALAAPAAAPEVGESARVVSLADKRAKRKQETPKAARQEGLLFGDALGAE